MIVDLYMADLTEPTDLLMDVKPGLHMLDNTEIGKLTKEKKHIEIRREFINHHIGKTVYLVYVM